MREMSSWTVAASLFFSIALFSSANEVVTKAVSLAAAGNPAAVQQSLDGLVSRMGGATAVAATVPEATGKVIAANYSVSSAARLQKEHDFALKQGNAGTLPKEISAALGLTDGSKGYDMMSADWEDDNDQSTHMFHVGKDASAAIVITYKPKGGAYAINWRTDLNGKLISTSYSTNDSVTTKVPNTKFAAEFDGQLKYWDNLATQMPATTVASN